MGGIDRALGGVMLLAASAVFTYYTTWAIILPFFDSSNPIHGWFPSREWAVRLPAFILVVGLSAIGLFLGSTIIRENRKKAEQGRLRTA
ncbi:dolichol phosphate-mannose biosynthesis regulatory [Gymnopilus junonius]|uniref:Dolichol phosphate-mannose biosynthesis regulatory protein n=1 Tax=Gymnopilus junonius TaxID=109634 RepID=A0A9P5TU66_GYMJU|nr:dolichol phosphate-mannose biosynthesis regulatory [Gymnopilus junonius]